MPFKKLAWPTLTVLVFFVSAGLLYYTWWLFQIERGNRALRKGDTRRAIERYEAAEAPFRKFPLLARILRADYKKLIFNKINVLYTDGQSDEAIENLEKEAEHTPFLEGAGEYSFWTGNVLLRRAIESEDPKVILKNLNAALSAYRRGLETQPDDWDLKFNYELVRHVLSQQSRGRKIEERVKSILKKMRPLVKPEREELPPEKRG